MSRQYEISGRGITQAIQKAVREGKNTAFVYDHDDAGNVLRVGYALVEPGASVTPDSTIRWLDPSEIHLVTADATEEGIQAELDVRFKQSEKAHTFTLIQEHLADEAQMRLRSLIREHASGYPGFVVQVEVRKAPTSQWQPAVRYDCAHGSFHRDMISEDGTKRKIDLSPLEGESAIQQAFAELATSLGSWLHELGYSPMSAMARADTIADRVREAEEVLLDLWRHPDDLADKESRFIQFR